MPGEVNNKLRPSHSDYTGSNGHYINTISPTNKAKKSMPNKSDEIKTSQYNITDNSDDTDIVFIYIYIQTNILDPDNIFNNITDDDISSVSFRAEKKSPKRNKSSFPNPESKTNESDKKVEEIKKIEYKEKERYISEDISENINEVNEVNIKKIVFKDIVKHEEYDNNISNNSYSDRKNSDNSNDTSYFKYYNALHKNDSIIDYSDKKTGKYSDKYDMKYNDMSDEYKKESVDYHTKKMIDDDDIIVGVNFEKKKKNDNIYIKNKQTNNVNTFSDLNDGSYKRNNYDNDKTIVGIKFNEDKKISDKTIVGVNFNENKPNKENKFTYNCNNKKQKYCGFNSGVYGIHNNLNNQIGDDLNQCISNILLTVPENANIKIINRINNIYYDQKERIEEENNSMNSSKDECESNHKHNKPCDSFKPKENSFFQKVKSVVTSYYPSFNSNSAIGPENTNEFVTDPFVAEKEKKVEEYNKLKSFIENEKYIFFVILLLIINSVLLGFWDMSQSVWKGMNTVISIYDIILQSYFTIEVVLYIFAYKNKYIHNSDNIFILILTLLGWIPYITGNVNSSLAIMYVFRAIRPLRLILYVPGNEKIRKCIGDSMYYILSILLIYLIIYLTIASVGVSFYKGKFHHVCDGETDLDELYPVCSINDKGLQCGKNNNCTLIDNNPNYNITSFDNIGSSMMIMSEFVLMEGWSDISLTTENTGLGVTDLFIFIVLIITGYIFINSFTVIISTLYNNNFETNLSIPIQLHKHEKPDELKEWNRDEKEVAVLSNKLKLVKLYEEGNSIVINYDDFEKYKRDLGIGNTTIRVDNAAEKEEKIISSILDENDLEKENIRNTFNKITSSILFKLFIFIVVIYNIVLVSLYSFNNSSSMKQLIFISNIVCNIIYTIEAILLFGSVRKSRYATNFINIFDDLLLICFWIDTILYDQPYLYFLRVFKIIRYLTYFNAGKKYGESLSHSITHIITYLIVAFIFLYITAIISYQIYWNLDLFYNNEEVFNFDSVSNSIISTFIAYCKENLHVLLFKGYNKESFTAVLYYVLMILIGICIIYQLFVAIIINGFRDKGRKDNILDMKTDDKYIYYIFQR